MRKFDPAEVGWLFVLTDDRDHYLIPSAAIEARSALCLGEKMKPYLVGTRLRELPFEDAPTE